MLNFRDIPKGLTSFTYHEEGRTRAWLVHSFCEALPTAANPTIGEVLEGCDRVRAPLMDDTAENLLSKGGIEMPRIERILKTPELALKPGMISKIAGFNDGDWIIVDGRHRYVALTLLKRRHPNMIETMNFFVLTEEQLSPFEIDMEGDMSEEEAALMMRREGGHKI